MVRLVPRRRRTDRHLLMPALMLSLSPLLPACGSTAAPLDECIITFERLGGAPSQRSDLLREVGPDDYRRVVRENGTRASGAIFYRFTPGPEASYRVEELDADADETVDASMTRTRQLFDLIDLYQVDAVADDSKLDSLQVSVPLPSSRFGRWNPARAYYTLPCGPAHTLTADNDGGLITLSVDIGSNGTVDTEMRLFFVEGVLQRWIVDNRVDGVVDFRATLAYDDEGRVTSVEWQDWEFSPVSRSEWLYEEGRLTTFSEDANGSGNAEHVVHYAAGCFDGEGER